MAFPVWYEIKVCGLGIEDLPCRCMAVHLINKTYESCETIFMFESFIKVVTVHSLQSHILMVSNNVRDQSLVAAGGGRQ